MFDLNGDLFYYIRLSRYGDAETSLHNSITEQQHLVSTLHIFC